LWYNSCGLNIYDLDQPATIISSFDHFTFPCALLKRTAAGFAHIFIASISPDSHSEKYLSRVLSAPQVYDVLTGKAEIAPSVSLADQRKNKKLRKACITKAVEQKRKISPLKHYPAKDILQLIYSGKC